MRSGEIHRGAFEREINPERAAFAGRAFDGNAAASLAHDSVNRCEPETGPFPRTLRREKWLEDVGLGFFVHPGARVGHGEHDVIAGNE